MAENLPVVVTDLCLCPVPFTSVVCSVSWILKSWHISVVRLLKVSLIIYVLLRMLALIEWGGPKERIHRTVPKG